ncbi:hypothetical protein [Gimesia aquarii]|uniref:Uncharacterized protein n=1 Tax=Gimesia aquarii TaxID=2527964 RepID=A0A517WS48_9PLAN|nr:hypothetical protein [Gimesia aquarii]QDU08082.1 hypothetical protein V202x_14450 [Gimesia aquarii]
MQSYLKILILTGLVGTFPPLFVIAQETATDPFKPFPDQLAPSLFNEVQDRDFRGIIPEEKALYYYVLKHLRETSLKDQKLAAEFNLQQRRAELKTFQEHPELTLPLFRDIFKNSSRYKGRLVTLKGRVRKLMHYPAEKNEYGIQTLYEAWLFTDDSQQNPTVVVCTEVPEALQNGLPAGTDVIDNVTVTGYLFKMYAYNAQDTTRVAPLILARQLEWSPAITDEKGSQAFLQLMAGAFIILIAGVAIVMWKTMQKDKQFKEKRLQANQDQVSFDRLESQSEPSKAESNPESKSDHQS